MILIQKQYSNSILLQIKVKFFIIEEAKEAILDFSQVTAKVIQFHYNYINFQYNININSLNVTLKNVKLSTLQLNKLKKWY